MNPILQATSTHADPALPLTDEEATQLGEHGMRLYESLWRHLDSALTQLPDKPEESTNATLRALWHLASGTRVSAATALEVGVRPISTSQEEGLRVLVERRISGEPLAHLTERQRFFGLEMLAGPAALIPRRETELLASAAASVLGELVTLRKAPCVIDACTGCGNIALSLAHHFPSARIHASDLSADAIGFARKNADLLRLSSPVDFRVGDLLAPFETDEFPGQVDLLTCNPPYISTKRLDTMPKEIIGHEPALAFDGGPLGVRILQRLIEEAPRFLRQGGWLAFEVGLGQGPAVRKRLEASGSFTRVEHVADENGDIRVLLALH
jgi:release factor glutamine methyltransferase